MSSRAVLRLFGIAPENIGETRFLELRRGQDTRRQLYREGRAGDSHYHLRVFPGSGQTPFLNQEGWTTPGLVSALQEMAKEGLKHPCGAPRLDALYAYGSRGDMALYADPGHGESLFTMIITEQEAAPKKFESSSPTEHETVEPVASDADQCGEEQAPREMAMAETPEKPARMPRAKKRPILAGGVGEEPLPTPGDAS